MWQSVIFPNTSQMMYLYKLHIETILNSIKSILPINNPDKTWLHVPNVGEWKIIN